MNWCETKYYSVTEKRYNYDTYDEYIDHLQDMKHDRFEAKIITKDSKNRISVIYTKID